MELLLNMVFRILLMVEIHSIKNTQDLFQKAQSKSFRILLKQVTMVGIIFMRRILLVQATR